MFSLVLLAQRDYVRDLRLLVECYIRPLQARACRVASLLCRVVSRKRRGPPRERERLSRRSFAAQDARAGGAARRRARGRLVRVKDKGLPRWCRVLPGFGRACDRASRARARDPCPPRCSCGGARLHPPGAARPQGAEEGGGRAAILER